MSIDLKVYAMKYHIFYLEPYVLLDVCEGKALLVNTLDNRKLLFDDKRIVDILVRLEELRSATILLSDNDLSGELGHLVAQVREKYMGDLFEIDPSKGLPFQFPLFNSYKNLMKERLFNKDVNNITDVILEECQDVTSFLNEDVLRFLDFFRGNQKVRFTIHVKKGVSIKGLKILLKYIGNKNQVSLLFDYKSYDDRWNDFVDDNLRLKACVYPHIDTDILAGLIARRTDFRYIFYISSLEDYEVAMGCIRGQRLDNYEVIPFFSGENIDFLKENVFISLDDLLGMKMDKKRFFANHFVNTLSFGKIYITETGIIYADPSETPIGTVKDMPIHISNECLKSSSWIRTRLSIEPCRTCIFRTLCPPIGDLERTIGTYDLCFKRFE